MFKRGDIIKNVRRVKVGSVSAKHTQISVVLESIDSDRFTHIPLNGENEGKRCTDWYEKGVHLFEMYDAPPYTKDGRRFVPSGEYRVPGVEWVLLSGESYHGPSLADNRWMNLYPILLPVPELEPEHEFQVGDWVRHGDKDPFKISSIEYHKDGSIFMNGHTPKHFGGGWPSKFTKLPGRPLQVADLMRVLSGDKVMVECHACGCEGVREKIVIAMYDNGVFFFHETNGESIANFRRGSIVFADGVEGNIFVIEEGD